MLMIRVSVKGFKFCIFTKLNLYFTEQNNEGQF